MTIDTISPGETAISKIVFTIRQLCERFGFMEVDITNKRIGINKSPGAFDLDVAGAVQFGSTVNAVTGYKVNGAAASGNILQGDGTNFVSAAGRVVLTAARTYYVRTVAAAITFTNASANVTWTTHGLSVSDAVIISIQANRTSCTITNASPAVVSMTNTFAAGQPVVFSTSGYLPPGMTAGTTYYVIATGLSGSAFQFSASVGGAAINTPKQTVTASSGTGAAILFTASGNHGLVAGQEVAFSTTGSLPTNITASTTYYVAAAPAVGATTFYVSTVNGGANVAFSAAGSNNSIEQIGGVSSVSYGSNTAVHLCSKGGTMPTFSIAGLLVQGTTYYVGTVVDANTITLSTTVANANPLGTATVATGTPIYTAVTGSDSNTGLAQTRAGALLTIQQAIDNAAALDLSLYSVTVQLASSTYLTVVICKSFVGVGPIYIVGDETAPTNVVINTTSVQCISANAVAGLYSIRGMRLKTTTSGIGLLAGNGTFLEYQNIDFNGIVDFAVYASPKGTITATGNSTISGNMTWHFVGDISSFITHNGYTVTLIGVPAFSGGFAVGQHGCGFDLVGNTFIGSGTGSRYLIATGGWIETNSAGVNALPGNAAGTGGTTAGGGFYT